MNETAAPHNANGLTAAEADERLRRCGPNTLPAPRPPSLVGVFIGQFMSPLIYVLLAASAVSVALGDIEDALFIFAVLLINAIVGTTQEYSAGRAAAALRQLEQPHATVLRDGRRVELDASALVPDDVVLVEAGARVPADLQLLEAEDLRCDESLLTGESLPVGKAPAADSKAARLYAGSTVVRGRGTGCVIATGAQTELGRIAAEIARRSVSKPPLVIRMERFSRLLALAMLVAILALWAVGFVRGMGWQELFMLAIGLAVAAIPEGLPVAISVALAIGMRRMAKVGVIVRKMAAVESLGSCTMIATDKTGTLTLNQLTVTDLCLPDGAEFRLEPGDSTRILSSAEPEAEVDGSRLAELLLAAALPNEADIDFEDGAWRGRGDMVDIALLGAARKGGIAHEAARADHPLLGRIAYEPDRRYAASVHRRRERISVFVKGAPETVIDMCAQMDVDGDAQPIDRQKLLLQKQVLAARGLRVLAFASGDLAEEPNRAFSHNHLVNLTFLGLVGMQDPVRPEVPEAVARCRSAGIEVAMLTGDDPATAATIARHAGLAFNPAQVVTGAEVRLAEEQGAEALDALTAEARLYARVEPQQKLAIVLSMARNGHFVAVTGDGVNDAPALKHAHVGVAMGLRGTDVAKESADLVVTDDNFASIVKGVLEGRVAYNNIRKVIFLLVSTGAAELAMFLLAIPLGFPAPLTAVQLLWLNLVTNGIQDVALATEQPEGDELKSPPRRPGEPIFDRLMIRRVLISAILVGGGSFLVFAWLLSVGYDEATARNLLLLLLVLVENVQTLNSRSEHRSLFRQRLSANPFLLIAVVGATTLHVGAMFVPGLAGILEIHPLGIEHWWPLPLLALTLVAVVELDKALVARRRR